MRYKIRFDIGFHGSRYNGWQNQGGNPVTTVEISPGVCYGWNKLKGCRKKKCMHKHVCGICGSDKHGARQCDSDGRRDQETNNAKRPRIEKQESTKDVSEGKGTRLENDLQKQSTNETKEQEEPFLALQDVVEKWISGSFWKVLKIRSSGVITSSRTDKGVHAKSLICYVHVNSPEFDTLVTNSGGVSGKESHPSAEVEMTRLHEDLSNTCPPDVWLNCIPAVRSAKTNVKKTDLTRKTYKYYLVVPKRAPRFHAPNKCSNEGVANIYNDAGGNSSGKRLFMDDLPFPSKADLSDFAWVWPTSISLGESQNPSDSYEYHFDIDEKKATETIKADFHGKRDFSMYATGVKPGPEQVRTIHEASLRPVANEFQRGAERSEQDGKSAGQLFEFSVSGDGFMKHMVRRLVGHLVDKCVIVTPLKKETSFTANGKEASDTTAEEPIKDTAPKEQIKDTAPQKEVNDTTPSPTVVDTKRRAILDTLFGLPVGQVDDWNDRKKPRRAPPHGLWLWGSSLGSEDSG